jgi:hypothetical protein
MYELKPPWNGAEYTVLTALSEALVLPPTTKILEPVTKSPKEDTGPGRGVPAVQAPIVPSEFTGA